MYFTSKDGCQNFLVFAQILSTLILESNKKVTYWISIIISSETKPFDTNLHPITPNLANGRDWYFSAKKDLLHCKATLLYIYT